MRVNKIPLSPRLFYNHFFFGRKIFNGQRTFIAGLDVNPENLRLSGTSREYSERRLYIQRRILINELKVNQENLRLSWSN